MILTLAGNLLVILVQLVAKGNFLASFYFQYNQLQYNAKNTRPWSSKAQISDGSQQRHLQQVIMQSSHAKPHNGHTNHLVSDESPFQTPSSGQRRNHLCQCDKSQCLGPSLFGPDPFGKNGPSMSIPWVNRHPTQQLHLWWIRRCGERETPYFLRSLINSSFHKNRNCSSSVPWLPTRI